MGFKYTYTKEQYEAVMALAEIGFSMRKIHRDTGVPYDTVRGWVKRGNKPLHAWTEEDWAKKKGNSQGTRDEWTEERREEFIEKCRITKLGENNPMWLGDDITGERRTHIKSGKPRKPMTVTHPDSSRDRIRRKYKSVTILLRKISGVKWEIHHIDGNPFNNEDDNLAISTRKGHMAIDGRLEKVTKIFTENNPGMNNRRNQKSS